jgi:hypothetical protein
MIELPPTRVDVTSESIILVIREIIGPPRGYGTLFGFLNGNGKGDVLDFQAPVYPHAIVLLK